MQSPNLPKLIAQINASPSFYMRAQPEFQQLSLPPVSPVFRSPGPKRSYPGYNSNNSASFSDANMHGFPPEMSPMRAEIQRAKDNRFTESFVAGGYRDSRMGVPEMRKRRVQRLRARQEVIQQAQGQVEASIAAIEDERAAKRHFLRQKRLKLWAAACQVIQRFMRGRLARKRCAQRRVDRLKAREDQVRYNAATVIQRFVLRRLAVFFEQDRLRREGQSDSDSDLSSDEESGSDVSERGVGDDGDDGSVPLRKERSGRKTNTYLSHLTQVDTSEDGNGAWNSAVVLSEAHAFISGHHHHDGEDDGSGGSGNSSAKNSRRGSSSSHSSGGRRSKSTKANFLTGQGRSREEQIDAEEQDRQRRQGILAANHYVKGNVNFMQVVASCSMVQMRVRRFLAIRRRTKLLSAIALLRWFFGKFFRTAPLHLQILARCGKPRLMDVVEGRDVVSFGRASSSNMLLYSHSHSSHSSSRHHKRAPKRPNAKIKQVLSAFKTRRKLGVGVVLPSLVTKWLDNRNKYTRGTIGSSIGSRASNQLDDDSFDVAAVDGAAGGSGSADSKSGGASRRSTRRNASSAWSAASLGISRGMTQSQKHFVVRDELSAPHNGSSEVVLGGDQSGAFKSRPNSRANTAYSRDATTPPSIGAQSSTTHEKKSMNAKPPRHEGNGVAAAEDMFRAKARDLIIKRPKAAHNAWDMTAILLRMKDRHTQAVEEASLEARQSKAVLKLQSRARILMATRRMATLVAAAQERQFRLATRAVQQQLARFPPEAADSTAAPQWLKHVAPPPGGPASGGGLASRQAGAQLRAHRGALNLRRTARDTFWLGGGAEVGAVGSDPNASREVALLSPQKRQPPPAVAARVRGVIANPGLLSSGLEASRFQGNAGKHPPGT